jgi:hypothetical protein
MTKVLASLFCGIAIGVLLVPCLFYLYVRSGVAPVTTAAPPLLFEKALAKTALYAKMDAEIIRNVPIASTKPHCSLAL